ncbi:MAG: hypothetical protein IPG45_18305 [Deltaproteobacteria bacterium]|jgi:hypothetical protein|nr:hypothetical protein [Deltaproteobacteria bacterium]
MSLFGLALLLPLAGSPDFIVNAAVRAETRGGMIPYAVGAPASEAIDLELLPQARLALQHDDGRLTLGYGPRLFRRFINLPEAQAQVTNTDRFLVLHSLDAGYRHILSRSWSANATGSWQRGESDYGALTTQVGGTSGSGTSGSGTSGSSGGSATSANNGSAALIALSTLLGTVGLEGALDSTQRISFGGQIIEVRSIGDQTGGLRVPRSLTIGGNAAWELALTRVDLLRLAANVDVVKFDALDNQPALDFRNVSLLGGLERALTDTARLGGQLGLLVINSEDTGTQVQPIGALAFSFSPIQTRNVRGEANITVGVDGFANPLLGAFQTRLNAGVGMRITVPPDWSFGLNGTLVTPIDEQASGAAAITDNLLGQTVLSAALPIAVRLDENFSLEFGGRFSALAPRFDDPNFRLASINLVAYLAITAAVESVL